MDDDDDDDSGSVRRYKVDLEEEDAGAHGQEGKLHGNTKDRGPEVRQQTRIYGWSCFAKRS